MSFSSSPPSRPFPLWSGWLVAGLAAWGPRPQETGGEGRILLEGLDGSIRTLAPAEVAGADPRELGAWVLRPEGFEPPDRAPAEGPRVRVNLVGGDELFGHVHGGQGERLELALMGGLRLPISVERIRSLWFPDHLPQDTLIPVTAPPEGDRLYRRAARALDVVDGTLEAFTPEGVLFDSVEVGQRTFRWDEVAALFVELLDGDPSSGPRNGVAVLLDLVDASRVRGALRGLDGAGVELTVGGSDLRLPWAVIAELAVDDGRRFYLSQLEPVREEGRGTPFDDDLGMAWPHARDRNVLGEPLTCGGKEWRHGIGMHAPSRLVFELPKGCDHLRGSVGIDDSVLVHPSHARGSVVFRVRLDGEVVFESPVVRGGDPPLALSRIPLAGRTTLVLEADPHGDFMGDRADWLELVVVCDER